MQLNIIYFIFAFFVWSRPILAENRALLEFQTKFEAYCYEKKECSKEKDCTESAFLPFHPLNGIFSKKLNFNQMCLMSGLYIEKTSDAAPPLNEDVYYKNISSGGPVDKTKESSIRSAIFKKEQNPSETCAEELKERGCRKKLASLELPLYYGRTARNIFDNDIIIDYLRDVSENVVVIIKMRKAISDCIAVNNNINYAGVLSPNTAVTTVDIINKDLLVSKYLLSQLLISTNSLMTAKAVRKIGSDGLRIVNTDGENAACENDGKEGSKTGHSLGSLAVCRASNDSEFNIVDQNTKTDLVPVLICSDRENFGIPDSFLGSECQIGNAGLASNRVDLIYEFTANSVDKYTALVDALGALSYQSKKSDSVSYQAICSDKFTRFPGSSLLTIYLSMSAEVHKINQKITSYLYSREGRLRAAERFDQKHSERVHESFYKKIITNTAIQDSKRTTEMLRDRGQKSESSEE